MKPLVVAAGLVAALALSGGAAHAQSGAARGKVLDEKGQPLQDAKVEIEYLGGVTRRFELKTSKKGEYTQVGMPPGEYKVTATKEGYQGGYVTLRIGLGEPTMVPDFKLLSRDAAAAKAGPGKGEQISTAFKAAYELTQQGKLDEAEAAYKELLVKTPDIPEAYYNLGVVASKKKDFAAAEGHYKKVVELQPDNADAWVALAENYQFLNQPDKVVEVFNQALEGQKDDPKLLFGLAVYHFNSGRTVEAGDLFNKVIQLDPTKTDAHYYLGSVSVAKNDVPGAVKHFEAYLASAPTNPQNKATAEGLLAYLTKKK